jgi:hypothetical protein
VRLAVLLLVALALTGCESNQERSAKIEKVRKPQEEAVVRRLAAERRALTITRVSTKLRVTGETILQGSEGSSTAVVTLRNLTATAMREVPIQIDVEDAAGKTIFTNDTPGASSGLSTVPLVGAHATATWIDDQVLAAGKPASVSAKLGEGTPVGGAAPSIAIVGAHQYVDPTNGPALEGTVVNRSNVAQQELIVDAVVQRAGKVLAAGRAVLPSAPVGSQSRFQLFFAGKPTGGTLEVSAPATSFG